jgi:hypothetical protein
MLKIISYGWRIPPKPMKYAHVTVYPSRIEWRCRRRTPRSPTISGSVSFTPPCRGLLAWGRVMLSLTTHGVDEMEIRYEEEDCT